MVLLILHGWSFSLVGGGDAARPTVVAHVALKADSFASRVSATETGLYTVVSTSVENLNPLYHFFISAR